MSQAEPLSNLVKIEQIPPETSAEAEKLRFLRFYLGDRTEGLLSLERLVEVIKVNPQEILAIPEVPEYLLGIANRRGEAVWIVDLPYLMGANHLSQRKPIPQVCMAILLQAEEQAIGLLVDRVSSIELHSYDDLQSFSAQTLPPQILTFLEGYFIDQGGNTLTVLDVDSIIAKVEN
ncbi:MAG: chemotaxis protein CheW [Xenococcaceae cyanobacterium]